MPKPGVDGYVELKNDDHAILIDLESIVAIQRNGSAYTIYTTGGPISAPNEAVGQEVYDLWRGAIGNFLIHLDPAEAGVHR